MLVVVVTVTESVVVIVVSTVVVSVSVLLIDKVVVVSLDTVVDAVTLLCGVRLFSRNLTVPAYDVTTGVDVVVIIDVTVTDVDGVTVIVVYLEQSQHFFMFF